MPPRPNASPSANATGAISGEGTSSNPWLVEVGNTLTITGTATQEWEDANSVLMISTSNSTKASSYSSSIQYSSESPTESTSVTIYYRYVNSSAEIVSSNNRYKTVYYQFVQPRTVNFNAGTGTCADESLTEASYGAGITLPSATPQTDCATAGWTFAGWAKASQAETTSAPELLTAGSTYTNITDGETLYAVYKKGDAAYELVTSAPSNWAGKYLIAANATTFMDGSLPGGSSSGQVGYANTSVNPETALSGNKVTTTWGDEHYLEIEAIDSEDLTKGYLLKTHNVSTPYIYNTASAGDGKMSANVNRTTADDHPYTITFKSSSEIDLRVHNNASLRYNSSNKIFRFYNNSNESVCLYRYIAGDVTYNSNPIADVQYDLTFDLNGATAGTQPAVAKHKQNDEITEFPSVADFVKEGYRCIGWNTTNNATEALESYTMPGEAATLYAVWIPTYAINWVVEGVTTHTDLPINGETISAPTTDPASINNRVFVGWSNTEITGHANTFTNFTSHTCTGETETWYAVFATPEYEVTTELEDKGTYIITSQKGGKIVYLPNAAATGGDGPALGKAIDINGTKISTIVTNDMLWTFNSIEGGWQIQSVAETDKYLGTTTGDGKTVRVNTSYNKAWTIADNTMKYNANESKCLYIGPYTADDHWYANSSSTSNKFASTTITFYTPVNSYRNYTTAPSTATYSVVYDLAEGEGTAINQYELLTGASVTLPAAPSKFGYSFAGWSDGSQTYDAGAPYTIGSANVTLTAQWTILVPTSFTLASSNGYDLGTVTKNTTQMSVASWEPANLLDSQKGVTWSIKSGDESYLTVDENGLVTVIGCSANATVVATSIADPNITAEFTVHIYAPFCPGYSFRYGTEGQGDWNNCDPVCFTETDKADGYEGHLFISDLFTIPNKPKFEVWWEDRREGWSEFADMTALPLHHLHSNRSIYKIEEGKGLGATGYLVIYGGYNTKNKYIDFMPDGYVLRLGSGDIWTSVPFYANEDIWSTTWETDIVELTNDITSGNFYVGVKTAEDYVWLEGISNNRAMTNMGQKSGKGEKDWGSNISSSDNGKHGKFRIYANSNDENGNWFCHFVPYYQIAFNSDGGSAVASGYVSIEADSKSYTVTMSPATNPTRVGYQFAGWNDGSTTHTESWTINNISQDINLTAVWNKVNTLTFHYDGFTTDCDEQWSVATEEHVTLPAGKAVVGKTFDGWSDGNTTYQAGASYTMPANDVTLTATYTNWTISYNYNGTIVSGVEVPETGVVIPTVAEGTAVDNNIFIGFTKTQLTEAITDLPADFIAAGSVYTPAAAGEILYALYRQGDAEYKLIKDIKDLRLGAHVVLASIDEDYAMGKTFIAGQDTLPAIVVTKDGDEETITFGKDVQEWTLTTNGTNVGTWTFKRTSTDNKKYLASKEGAAEKVNFTQNITTASSFTISVDASGRVTAQSVATTNTRNTLSMGEKGFFACYRLQDITTPDLAIYQHIGTKYVTTPAAVYRVKSVDMINGRLDKNDYYTEGVTIDLNGYANDGYSTSNRYLVLGETNRDTISKTKTFTMPAYNVIDTLTNRAKQDTIAFMVPECVQTQATQRVDWNSVIELPEVANVNAWNFVGWVRTAINDTTENHTEIFTSYTVPHVDRDTFYAIYSYDGLPTTGFVLSTVNSATTYYLGKYESGYDNRYFNAVTDKAQALVLHNNGGKLYYQSGDTVAYLKANAQGTEAKTYNLLTTNEAGATVWTIDKNEETNVISIKTTINATDRYLRYSNANARYNIYTNLSDPVSEKALSYTTNPVCAQYAYYFTSDEEGAEPEYVYELGQDGKAMPYSPANECDAKRFMGWSETKVTALQQSAPSMVDVATQTYDRDVTLYAVYAAENGGKVVDTPTITDDVTAMGAFKTTQDSGMTSLNTRYFYHNAELYDNTLRLKNGKNLDSSYITTSLIRDLEKIQVVYNESNLKPIVSISSDGTSWTEISLNKVDEIYIATPDEPGDYYVAFSIKRSSSDNYSYSRIRSVTYTHNKQYWYSDYSTNCNTDETATISFKNEDESQAHEPVTATAIGQVITLPTLKVAGQHFDHWTINDVEYEGGESYKLSHDVTAIATMSEAQLVCSPETLYVTSAKGKTVRSTQTIHITCPDITEGTLTIADQTSDNGATIFHAVITNAEANEETGLNATVAIEFTHNAQNQNRNATMTATIGEEPNQKQVQFQVRGRSLPDKFVIAHQGTDSKWYALPADITAYNTYAGYVIPVVDNKATATTNAIYHLGVDETDHSIVRLMATDTTALMTHATADNINIKVGKVADDETGLSQWYIQSADNESFVIKNVAKNGKNLIFNSQNKFGMFQNGDTLLRILPVANEVAVINLDVTQWETNGFTFLPSISIPTHDAFSLVVNEETIVGATCVARYDLYDVNNIGSIGTQQTMQLQWFKDSKPVATATVVSPARVTGNITLSSLLTEGIDAKNLDIVVASGTLTVDAKATIHNLDICAGATVAITNDTLTATTLSFHGGLTSTESNYNYDVPRLYIQKEGYSTAAGYIKKNTRVYYYLNVNADNYYPFTVPFKTSGSNIRYASRPNTDIQSIWGSAIKISKYNGEARGKGQSTETKYWQDLSYSSDIIPGVGYIITAKKQKKDTYATLRLMMMVSDIDATTDTVSVGAWGVGPETTTAWYNQGWNYIANPYTAMLAGTDADEPHHSIQSGTEVRYATIPTPTVDGYDQVPMNEADLKPFYGFFIQASETGNYNFVKENRHQAPAYLLAEQAPEQEASIQLSGAGMSDVFGLIAGNRYSDRYEINADLTKELGTANDLRAWLMSDETKMAYLAVNDETARTLIPLNLRTPAEGEYTFSLRKTSKVDDLEGLYLYDYQTGAVTNLILSDYSFTAPPGGVVDRFALSAIRMPKAPTDMNKLQEKENRMVVLKDGHIYILVNEAMYTAEGKEVTK